MDPSSALRGYGRCERKRTATPITSCATHMTLATDFLSQMHVRMLMILPGDMEDYWLDRTIDD